MHRPTSINISPYRRYAVYDLYRRQWLCSFLLLISSPTLQATIALLSSYFFVILWREAKPFYESATDIISYVCGE